MSRKDENDAALWMALTSDPGRPSEKLARYWDRMPQWVRLALAAQVLYDACIRRARAT